MCNEEVVITWYVKNHPDFDSLKCLMLIDPYGKEFCSSVVFKDKDYDSWGYDQVNALESVLKFLRYRTFIFKPRL